TGIPEPRRRVGERDEGAALPRGGVPGRLWLGSGRPGGRAEGGPRGATGEPAAERRGRTAGSRPVIRVLGDELDGLQLRARCPAPRLEWSTGPIPHVPARGNERGQARQS